MIGIGAIGTAAKAAWGFMGSPLGKGALYVVGALGIMWWSNYRGYERAEAEWKPKVEQAQAELATARREHAAAVHAHNAALRASEQKYLSDLNSQQVASAEQLANLGKQLAAVKRQKEKVREVIREIPRYIPAAADAACIIPVGAVRVHDFAAKAGVRAGGSTGDSQFAPGNVGDDGAASGIALSGFVGTVALNYADYHSCASKLTAWQTWYTSNQTIISQINAARLK